MNADQDPRLFNCYQEFLKRYYKKHGKPFSVIEEGHTSSVFKRLTGSRTPEKVPN